jgi:hypothetical protein
MTEFIEEFLILDSLLNQFFFISESALVLRACAKPSTFRVVVMGSGIEEKRFPFLLIVEQISLD